MRDCMKKRWKKKIVTSGKSKKFTFKKMTKLSVYVQKKSQSVTKKKLQKVKAGKKGYASYTDFCSGSSQHCDCSKITKTYVDLNCYKKNRKDRRFAENQWIGGLWSYYSAFS